MHNFTAAPPNKIGFFSPQTSATNFCELDYEITPYIAEFINSISNLSHMYLGFKSLPAGSTTYNILSWPAANLALFSVGIGSFMFHATLRYGPQMCDELSMYAVITALNYGVYVRPSFTSAFTRALMAFVLVLPVAAVSYFNTTSSSGATVVIHLTLFVSAVCAFWVRTYYLINKLKYHPPVQQSSSSPSSQAYAEATRQHYLSRFRSASISFLLAFIVWLIDGLCCEQLRTVRAVIGLPFAWVFELHGTWHILTAISGAQFVRLVADLTSCA